ncbi:uncharacterized protein LOC143122221 isoform X2 [Alosa pseudoharengus]|uniref:uncharacterized protein LOC143122221 isoform X2 n=1 Tax=Alosa pseudoharengus TaxID=34774 RepID=UPI003F89916F
MGLSFSLHCHLQVFHALDGRYTWVNMLHSIFFFGHFNNLLEPEEVLDYQWHYTLMVSGFDRALTEYNCKLPTRTPFSYLLEMIVHVNRHPWWITQELKRIGNILHGTEKKKLFSSVICITYDDNTNLTTSYKVLTPNEILTSNKVLTYGASLSRSYENDKEIILAMSCLCTWHHLVSYAVMCKREGEDIGDHFRINLADMAAACIAFDVRTLKAKGPCKVCQEIFSLERNTQSELNSPSEPDHPPGNCAEAEAISELLWINRINLHANLDFQQRFCRLVNRTHLKLLEKLQKVGQQYLCEMWPQIYRA